MSSLGFSGCDNKYATAPVNGKLTLEGNPVAGAEIVFSPISDPSKTGRPSGEPGRASSGTVGKDGTFTITQHGGEPGAVVGPHKVSFSPPPTKRPGITREEREVMSPEEIKAVEEQIAAMPIYPPLPAGLNIAPAEVEVKPGKNTFEFVLSPSP